MELKAQDRNKILAKAGAIGELMAEAFPPLAALEPTATKEEYGGPGLIPVEAVEVVAETITDVVAEILQAWLDAGSEREVTQEELGGAIQEHVRGWSNDPKWGQEVNK